MSSSVEDDLPPPAGIETSGEGDAAPQDQPVTPAMHLTFNADGVSEIRYRWQSSADGRSWTAIPGAGHARLASRQADHGLSLTLALTCIFIDSAFSSDTALAAPLPAFAPEPATNSGNPVQAPESPADVVDDHAYTSPHSVHRIEFVHERAPAGGSYDNGGQLLDLASEMHAKHGSGVPFFLIADGPALFDIGGLLAPVSIQGSTIIQGGDGNDTLSGSDGDDTMFGGGGNDRLSGGRGNDIIHGGAGDDVVAGDEGDDVLAGDAGNDAVAGGEGNDTASGGGGDDTVCGDAGDDTVYGGSGNDTLYGDASDGAVLGGAGNDTVSGGAGDDPVFGDAGNDKVSGGSGDDAVFGGAGNDTVSGDAGNDIVSGGEGDDTVSGGTGDDTLLGGSGDDIFVYHYGDGNDSIMDFEDGCDELRFDGGAATYQVNEVDYGRDYTFDNGQVLAVHGNSGKGSQNKGSDTNGSGNSGSDQGKSGNSGSGSGGDTVYDDEFDYSDFGNQSVYDSVPGTDGDDEWADLVATGVIEAPDLDAPPAEDYAPLSDMYNDQGLHTLLGVSTITFSSEDHNLFG